VLNPQKDDLEIKETPAQRPQDRSAYLKKKTEVERNTTCILTDHYSMLTEQIWKLLTEKYLRQKN
jgi:hypothetical protein